jgi:hypothetical protein
MPAGLMMRTSRSRGLSRQRSVLVIVGCLRGTNGFLGVDCEVIERKKAEVLAQCWLSRSGLGLGACGWLVIVEMRVG